jgi:peptidyl-prolyl cis-trans isomerase B (cyclophilin B)
MKHNKLISFSVLLCIVCLLSIIGCGGQKSTPQANITETKKEEQMQTPDETTATEPKTESMPVTKTESAGKYLVIAVKIGDKSIGKIKIELYTKEAPKTSENLIKLARKGFYNGLTFHRVIPGFVIQGGDPLGNGTGGPGYTTPAEISPTLKHVRGAVAMARLGDDVNPSKASSGSQFYICHADAHFLDGKYTIVGQVVQGMDVVDQIAAVKTSKPGDMPVTPVVMEKVTVE